MERKIYEDLLKWKKDLNRKPLLLFGNRQIGKTYLALEFGEKEYILNRISSELGNQYITHRQTLLKTLYTFVESEYGNETNLNLELLGTTSFNLVWEKACASIFGNVLDIKIKKLVKDKKLPEIKNSKFNENNTIINWKFLSEI